MDQHINPHQYPHRFDRADLDKKICGSVDTEALHNSSIFAVGSGGANNIYESLVRLGVRKTDGHGLRSSRSKQSRHAGLVC